MILELSSREKQLARRYFANEVKRGRLQRPSTCSDCGVECRPDGHHTDYGKPLEVVWLCPPCHRKRHGKDTPRTEKVQVWLTAQEMELFKLSADRAGLTVSDWLRRAGNAIAARGGQVTGSVPSAAVVKLKAQRDEAIVLLGKVLPLYSCVGHELAPRITRLISEVENEA